MCCCIREVLKCRNKYTRYCLVKINEYISGSTDRSRRKVENSSDRKGLIKTFYTTELSTKLIENLIERLNIREKRRTFCH